MHIFCVGNYGGHTFACKNSTTFSQKKLCVQRSAAGEARLQYESKKYDVNV